MDQLVCSRVPLPQYIKDQMGEAGRPQGARQENPTPSGSRIPPPPILVGIGFLDGGKRERKKEKGAAPLVQFGLEEEGACGLPWPPLLFSTKAQ